MTELLQSESQNPGVAVVESQAAIRCLRRAGSHWRRPGKEHREPETAPGRRLHPVQLTRVPSAAIARMLVWKLQLCKRGCQLDLKRIRLPPTCSYSSVSSIDERCAQRAEVAVLH